MIISSVESVGRASKRWHTAESAVPSILPTDAAVSMPAHIKVSGLL